MIPSIITLVRTSLVYSDQRVKLIAQNVIQSLFTSIFESIPHHSHNPSQYGSGNIQGANQAPRGGHHGCTLCGFSLHTPTETLLTLPVVMLHSCPGPNHRGHSDPIHCCVFSFRSGIYLDRRGVLARQCSQRLYLGQAVRYLGP